MTKSFAVYKCDVCGNIVEVLHEGKGALACCNETMTLVTENIVDAAKEKHVPVIEKRDNNVAVKIGSVPHPMEEKHYIEWVEIEIEGKAYRQFLKPGESPEALFPVGGEGLTARAYCNIHGLWKS